ncbi:hypothetical protein SAMN05216240_0850 [Caldicellulosiruptor bescii]|uniref:Uncharacterized protein n=1 Tax=Caldicellulosiruptor bescii TaxID=31899 RepID=A0ABY1S6M6_CALBS|nr:hypothetical protein SAMN05216512_0934 [Caldicellulosiruptor bescii]SMR92154.1 hypothetical protein SAMN05216240_0850 [Caldicellulosiruptor bescii]SMR95524.1 hypothetical protein SAMN05216291_2525 [Caldicellulosiruptor bescii]SMR98302.1 hypothetical protein SAMN05216182_2519 [Caldicellulosiruptor bescii]
MRARADTFAIFVLRHRASPFKAQRAIFTLTFAFGFKRFIELFADRDTISSDITILGSEVGIVFLEALVFRGITILEKLKEFIKVE